MDTATKTGMTAAKAASKRVDQKKHMLQVIWS